MESREFSSNQNVVFGLSEAETRRKERAASGGSGQRKYEEGWIEFIDKNLAKFVAVTFNGQKIGGKKSDPNYDDLWNIRYLSGFKWDHLVQLGVEEKIARKKKLTKKVMDAKSDHDDYLSRSDKAQQVKALLKKKAAKIVREQGGDEDDQEAIKNVIASKLIKKKQSSE